MADQHVPLRAVLHPGKIRDCEDCMMLPGDPGFDRFDSAAGPSMPPPHWMREEKSAMIRTLKADANTGRARMKGQAEGLIVGLLFAGFFGLLLKWSF